MSYYIAYYKVKSCDNCCIFKQRCRVNRSTNTWYQNNHCWTCLDTASFASEVVYCTTLSPAQVHHIQHFVCTFYLYHSTNTSTPHSSASITGKHSPKSCLSSQRMFFVVPLPFSSFILLPAGYIMDMDHAPFVMHAAWRHEPCIKGDTLHHTSCSTWFMCMM